MCRTCRTKSAIKYNKIHREEKNKKRREWRKKFETKEMKRERNLRNIGWTTQSFSKTLKKQKGKCAICKCKLTFEDKISGTRACADHKHCKPPKPRGILCANCNLGIGNLKDDPEILRSALRYVRKFTRR